jgi:hypothetical protein
MTASTCDSSDHRFVCGVKNAEDIVRLPGARWVIASNLNITFSDTGFDLGFGPLQAIHIDTRRVSRLYPTAKAGIDWDQKTYPDCSTPPVRLSSHGLNVQPLSQGMFRLYVVNHGERESVEIIELTDQGQTLAATWRGCILAPEGIWPNAVAGLPDGGVALSGGGVAIWRPDRGWTTVDGVTGGNGLESSSDGRWLFVALPGQKSIVRVPTEGGEVQSTATDGVQYDNLRWGEDDFLYVAGDYESETAAKLECMKAGEPLCDTGFVLARLNPETLSVKQLLHSNGIQGAFGAAATALLIDGQFWLGAVRGDRLAIIDNPPLDQASRSSTPEAK